MRSPVRALVALALASSLVVPAAVHAQVDDPQPPVDGEVATVIRVIDGDTVRVRLENGDEERVRYIGIDTPEMGNDERAAEPYAQQATAANARFVLDQDVILERDVSERDRFDRLLRYVWVDTEDGVVMVNERMVALGLADVNAYEPDTKYHQYLTESLEQARFTGRGMHDAEAIAHALVGAEAMAYLFIDAYDARDGATLRQLIDRDVKYTLPDDASFKGKRNVMARFREEWSELDPIVEIRGSVAQPDAAVLELTITTTLGDNPGAAEAIGVSRWVDDRLVDYRIYRDE